MLRANHVGKPFCSLGFPDFRHLSGPFYEEFLVRKLQLPVWSTFVESAFSSSKKDSLPSDVLHPRVRFARLPVFVFFEGTPKVHTHSRFTMFYFPLLGLPCFTGYNVQITAVGSVPAVRLGRRVFALLRPGPRRIWCCRTWTRPGLH